MKSNGYLLRLTAEFLAVLRLMVNPTESLIYVYFITNCRKENSLLARDLFLFFFHLVS